MTFKKKTFVLLSTTCSSMNFMARIDARRYVTLDLDKQFIGCNGLNVIGDVP